MTEQTQASTPPLRRIRAKNLLSFGPDGIDLELSALNVLIGPNGSGKSNLFEVVGLFRAASIDLPHPVRNGGGIRNWIWRGRPESSATVEAVVDNPKGNQPIRHVIEFAESNQEFTLTDERIENECTHEVKKDPYFFYRYQGGRPVLNPRGQRERQLQKDDVDPYKSILSQRKDPDQFPELTHLSDFYGGMRLYRDWEFGPGASLRIPQDDRYPQSPLGEQAANLGVFLNRLRQYPKAKAKLFEKLRDLYEGLTDFELNFKGGSVQISFTEREFDIPASRLSDGSLRYLTLLAILLDPEPPRFIGIEEPELGLHPDLIPKMADLLVDASTRSQLLVTTHSDILVDALSHRPESVVVCEKHNGQTSMRRLDRSDLKVWLEKYSLGELWTSGDLGGVRW